MKKHLATTVKYILREDGSSFHRYIFDYDTGKPLYGATAQGTSDDSCWARGQAWGIDGFALNYKDTKNEDGADMIRYKKAVGEMFNSIIDNYAASYDMDCDGLILRGKIRRITKVFGCSKSAILPHLLFLKFFIK